MTTVTEFLVEITKRAEEQFKESQAVLSFDQYIQELISKPRFHLRNCAQDKLSDHRSRRELEWHGLSQLFS